MMGPSVQFIESLDSWYCLYTTESQRKTIANFRQWCRSVGIERSLVNNVRLFKCQKATHQSRIATIYREQTAIFNKVFLCI